MLNLQTRGKPLRIIKDNRIIKDHWQRLATVEPDQAIPADDIIMPFPYWKEHRQSLLDHPGKIAVCLNGDDRIEDIANHLDQFELIALEFPVFRDGRCYSHARLLRDRYRYQGEIRAVGEVLRDQLFYMKRCGIDAFQLRDDKDFEDALKSFRDFSVTYQTAADGAPPIYKRR